MFSLPIEEALPRLRAALAAHAGVVLQAPPGAGKTTLVPLALLDEPVARRANDSNAGAAPARCARAAARMSVLRHEAVGETVGYRIRFDAKVSKATRIEVLTEGILTRRLQSDSALDGVGLVIFDEFHERHLHADLALALTLDSRRHLRPDLKILVMSATLDGAAVSKLLGNAPVVTSEGRSFPVDLRYARRDPEGALPPMVADAVQNALKENEGDALVFLPGAWEIRRTQELLEGALRGAAEVHPLYGDLPWEAQDRAIQPGKQRRVVLATPIAETSLTIEGVRIVVDAGYARAPQFDPVSGLTRLVTQRISRASSEQRAGRAGRLAPGVCYRLWTETTQRGLIPQSIPEIRQADLAPLALDLAAWGAKDVQRPFLARSATGAGAEPGACTACRSRCPGCRGPYHRRPVAPWRGCRCIRAFPICSHLPSVWAWARSPAISRRCCPSVTYWWAGRAGRWILGRGLRRYRRFAPTDAGRRRNTRPTPMPARGWIRRRDSIKDYWRRKNRRGRYRPGRVTACAGLS